MPLGDFGKGIKDALVSTIKGAGDVVGTTIDAQKKKLLDATVMGLSTPS